MASLKSRIRKIIYGRRLHCFTDSHGKILLYIQRNEMVKKRFNVSLIGGATASGLANPNSVTGAMKRFRSYAAQNINKNDPVLFMLGEVDCGFTIWHKVEKEGKNLEDCLNMACQNYQSFIAEICKESRGEVYIVSAIPTSLGPGDDIGDVANYRKHISSSQKARTELSIRFNSRMKDFAISCNYNFIDIDDELIDPNTGVLNKKYRNENASDHHLSDIMLAPVFRDMFEKISY